MFHRFSLNVVIFYFKLILVCTSNFLYLERAIAPILEFLYDQFELVTREQKLQQIVLLQVCLDGLLDALYSYLHLFWTLHQHSQLILVWLGHDLPHQRVVQSRVRRGVYAEGAGDDEDSRQEPAHQQDPCRSRAAQRPGARSRDEPTREARKELRRGRFGGARLPHLLH